MLWNVERGSVLPMRDAQQLAWNHALAAALERPSLQSANPSQLDATGAWAENLKTCAGHGEDDPAKWTAHAGLQHLSRP